jgi:lipopolysaccharide export LptBFGC system permease protein LptF
MQLSNDHSGDDNEGFQDIKKMLLTFLLSALVCLVVVLLIQWVLALSKQYRYNLVRLRKNYENLQRTSQLSANEAGNA